MEYLIRPYQKDDRWAVRNIACQTAFLGLNRERIFSDDQILADALTLYYTDYEPESCFVALFDNEVKGYVIGAKDIHYMGKVFNSKILLSLLFRAFVRGVFFRYVNIRFLVYIIKSALKKEFLATDFSKEFPATLHINIRDDSRGKGAGSALINVYLEYLKDNQVRGVSFGTLSDSAKDFFVHMGFRVLFSSKRTYLRSYTGKETNFYLLGIEL